MIRFAHIDLVEPRAHDAFDRWIKRLLGTVAVIGCAAGMLALAQDLTSSNAIFWFIPLSRGTKASGGPFVNHNNFAQFMNLSLGCAVALLLVKVQEASSSRRRSV